MKIDMADLPVQIPEAPATRAEERARYFNSGNAFNIKLPVVPSNIFREEAERALKASETGYIACDQSGAMKCDFPATTPLMLTRYATIRAGETLASNFNATGSIWYVIKGAGSLKAGAETIQWGEGDIFLLPGGVPADLIATADGVLWVVSNEPQLAFEGVSAAPSADAPVQMVHYPAAEIARQLDIVYNAGTNENTSGHALVFSTASTEASRNIMPTLTLSLNTLKPKSFQSAHKHNSAAITLVLEGDPAYSMVDSTKCGWSPFATLITPPAAVHSHHNDGPTRARFLIVQDGGFYYHARTMGFTFLG